jgi:uncharacterized membrane protein YcfT
VTETTSTAVPTVRDAWIDQAKGIAIILVVLFHSVMYLDAAGVVGPLVTLNPLLDTFRMPLFFFMSGILAAKAITLGFRALVRKRMLLLLYLYLLWVTLQTVLLVLVPPIGSASGNASPLDLVSLFIRPNSNLWFIYALPLFFAIAWLARRVPAWLQILVAASISVLFGTGLLHTGSPWDKMGRYLVFFIVAIWLGPFVRQLVPRLRWWHAVLLAALYAGATILVVKLDLLDVPFVLLATSALAVSVGIAVAVQLSKWPPFDWVRYLGTRTLPIYLVHTFPMIILAAVLVPLRPEPGPVLGTALPLALTVVAIVLALVGYRLLGGVPGLFTLPVARWADPAAPARAERSGPDVARSR